MTVETLTVSTEHNNYSNLTVYDILMDGVFDGWRVLPNEGYVMYDTTDYNVVPDPDNPDEVIEVTFYYTRADLPPRFNWNNFSWVAILRSEVDENYIFGVGEPDHEVM
jgi:hypothetical protein